MSTLTMKTIALILTKHEKFESYIVVVQCLWFIHFIYNSTAKVVVCEEWSGAARCTTGYLSTNSVSLPMTIWNPARLLIMAFLFSFLLTWWYLDLVIRFIRLTSEKTSKLRITDPLWGQSAGYWWLIMRRADVVLGSQDFDYLYTYKFHYFIICIPSILFCLQ